jgi:hypothetical protein
MLFDDRHCFTALQAVQSGSFASNYDAGWSLRRAEERHDAGWSLRRAGSFIGVPCTETSPSLKRATPNGVVRDRVARFSIDMQPLTGLFSVDALFTMISCT